MIAVLLPLSKGREAENFSAADAQRKIADGNLFAKHFAQAPRLNGKVFGLRQVPLRASVE